jgi:glycosyltransferase involved in cell wall biosynthesis
MRILVIYTYFGTPSGSWSTRIYELTRRWVMQGVDVEVITAPYEKSDIVARGFISKRVIDGIKLTIVNSGDNNRLRTYFRFQRALTFAIVSTFYALTKKYDVILVSSGPITVGIPMIFAKFFRGKRAAFEVRDLWPGGGIELGLIRNKFLIRIAWWFEKQCYDFADLIVTASPGQKLSIETRHSNCFVKVISNASDNELFGKRSNDKIPSRFRSKLLLTHIGSLGLIHNIHFWILVAQEIQSRNMTDIHLVFLGDGANRAILENDIKGKQLRNITFLGLRPKTELPLWLQNSAATLFATTPNPVQDTCSPNKIFDSFAAGKPVIQTSKGWIHELIDEKQCGLNIEMENVSEAVDKIVEYIMAPVLLRTHGVNAQRLAKTVFDREKLAKKYLNYLEELCSP